MRAAYLTKKYAAIFTWLVILVAIYFWMVSASQSFKNCIQNNAAQQYQNALGEIFGLFRCNVVFISSHEDLINTLSAFGLFIITGFLVWSGIAQTSTTRKQLRAYVSVDETVDREGRHVTMGPTGYLRTLASLKNVGETPALRLQYAFGLQVWPSDLPEEIFKTAKWSEKQIIQPGQEVIAIINDSETSEIDVLNGIKRGLIKTNIYVFGVVRYEDIFRVPHLTQFCFKVDYRNGWNAAPGWDWYKDYNKTDDQKTYISEYVVRYALIILRRPFLWGARIGAILPPNKE